MGKKGGKKEHNVDKAAENAEPNLSTIPEDTNLEQEKPEIVEQPTEGAEVPAISGVEENKTEDSDQKPGKAKKGNKGGKSKADEDPQTEEESSKKKGGKKGKKAVKEEEASKESVEKEVTKKSKEKKAKKQKPTTVDKEVQNESSSELAVPSKPILAQKDSKKLDKSRVSISERVTSFDAGEKKKKGKGGKRKSSQSVRDSTTFEEYEDDIPPKTRTRSVSVSKRSSFPSSGTRFSLYQTESDTAGRQRLSSIMSSDMSMGSSVDSEEILRKKSLEEKKKSKKDKKKPQEKEKKKAKGGEKKKPEKPVKAGKKGEMDYDEVKKLLDDLKQQAKELGVEDAAADNADKEDKKGPKKKASKKEKAKMTAEMAEKAKAEMEAQARRLEEMIRKKKEEDRLAAIEKDKRETLEQGLRMEQLQDSAAVIEDIIHANVLITKEEKCELEWKKYLECGKLPNPAVCAEMNTYLHLWDIDLDKTKMEDASERTTDALKLLGELDDLIETVSDEDKNKLENWYWIRQLFRDYQANCLDVATYRLLRNVERNLNRINIPTADFNFKDDHVTVCVWLRVMLPIPLPNPRRPPKPRIDISFNLMDLTALFPITVDCENAAIRAMYLTYDHLSDLSDTYRMPEVPPDFYMDMLAITKKEWRTQLKYKYHNRDITPIKPVVKEEPESEQTPTEGVTANDQPPQEEEKKIKFENTENKEWVDGCEDEVPLVPFKQLKPTASEFALSLEDELYNETRTRLQIAVAENVVNLRKFVILGGVFHLNLLAQPPQPQDFVTMDMTITTLYLPKKLKVLPFKVIYTPYIPPEPEPTSSDTSIRKLPEELEEEIKKQEEELDKLIFINVKWPSHVIFLELPVVCRWDEENSRWTSDDVYDVKHNEDKCMVSFRTGVFGIYGLATCRYSNLPFQAYDIKPEADDSVTVQLTAAILMLEFNVKDGLIAVTQLQNSPNMTMQDSVGKYMKLHKLKKTMMEAGIDIFPDFDAFCYVNGCCEKHWPMEKHLYYNMAQISNSFNFSWSRWNLPADRRKIVVQMREYFPDKGKQKNHQMLLVTPLKAAFIDCTEVSQTFSEKEVDTPKFAADLYHLMKTTSGIFVRNKVSKASKQNVYTLAQFLISIRVLSFS